MRPHGVTLEHHADIAVLGIEVDAALGAGDRVATDPYLAAIRLLEPGNASQSRRLAAAGRTEQGHELTLGNGEIDVLHRHLGTEILKQVVDLDHWPRTGHGLTAKV